MIMRGCAVTQRCFPAALLNGGVIRETLPKKRGGKPFFDALRKSDMSDMQKRKRKRKRKLASCCL